MSHKKHDKIKQLLVAHYSQLERGGCIPEADLARYASDDLSPAERQDLEKHLSDCPTCQKDLKQFNLAGPVWEEAQTASSPSTRWFSLDLRSGYGLVASAALVLIVISVVVFPLPESNPPNQISTKGTWQMFVAAKRNHQVFSVNSGDRLHTDDQLGFFYSSDMAGYLMILYVDSLGEIIRIFPASSFLGQRVAAGQEVRLPDSARLTLAQGCEWIIGVFSDNPFQEDNAQRAIQTMLTSREGCSLRPWEQDGKPIWPGVDIKIVYVKR